MNITKRILGGLVVAALLAGSSMVFAGTAFADPPEGSKASCMAYESYILPPVLSPSEAGVSEDYGWPGVLQVFAFVEAASGVNHSRGESLSEFAHMGEGNHEACDEAFVALHFGP